MMEKIEHLYRIIWMSRPLMQAAEAAVEKGLVGTGLTVRMRAILEMLHRHGDSTVPDLARELEIQRQYVQLMVNETLAEDLAVRIPNPRHKRSTLIALTEKGRILIKGVIEQERALVATIGAEIGASETEAALDVMMTLIEQLKIHNQDKAR
ncbi:MarR family winged helix-turn-helix transcriptional regulator [Arenibacterium sp. LLYu02]|uniref:MarR family winged helix-turn-helix transcriptional regulator n=1 Tax=Arenibacterium sp. LLYu02 TaxID=3404132 RepID=UPI003B21AEAA